MKNKFRILFYLINQNIKELVQYGRFYKKPDFEYFHLFKKSIELFQQKNLLFIHIPKTAGISIYSYVYDMNDTFGHFTIRSYQHYMTKKNYNQIKKFTIIRNPYERIISAYYFLKGGGINEKDRNWTNQNLNYENFDDFVFNGLDKENIKNHIHFLPQVYFLKNKQDKIDLDYILETEKLHTDIKKLNFNKSNKTLSKINTSKKSVNRNELSEDVKEKIYRFYEEDFKLLGFQK